MLVLFSMLLTLLTPLAATSAQAVTAPSIASDKDDYPPGGLVVLTGADWQPGETVHINVDDDQTKTWTRDVDVTADDDGKIRDSFNLPDWFVATYKVVATGAHSGTALTGFTDGNIASAIVPSGATATLTRTKYNSLGCTGTVDNSYPKSGTGTDGTGETSSLRLDASSAATSSTGATLTFAGWTVSGSTHTVISGTGNRSICVAGTQSGGVDATVSYSSRCSACWSRRTGCPSPPAAP